MIQENIKKVLDSIDEYDTKLICVSKTRSVDEIMEAYNMGMRDFGENIVQELVKKKTRTT